MNFPLLHRCHPPQGGERVAASTRRGVRAPSPIGAREFIPTRSGSRHTANFFFAANGKVKKGFKNRVE